MPPINESDIVHNGTASSEAEAGPRKFTFPSHQFHMVTLAKMCQENKDYTDCVIKIDEEELRAHRLVLGSVSPFLKLVFSDIPSNLSEATILVPGVKKRVVKALLDFFYTGQMIVERGDTSDLQLLIDTLQIDPGLITVDAVSNEPLQRGESKEESQIEQNDDDGEAVETKAEEAPRTSRKRKPEKDDDESGTEMKKPLVSKENDESQK